MMEGFDEGDEDGALEEDGREMMEGFGNLVMQMREFLGDKSWIDGSVREWCSVLILHSTLVHPWSYDE